MSNPEEPTWNPIAAVCAWLLPGLGHWLIGEKRRAMILGVTIGSLWLTGMLVGGVSVIDLKENQYWFFGQVLTAPSLLVQSTRWAGLIEPKTDELFEEGEAPVTYEPAYGRPAEQGILYTALAGMLNLLAVIDVIYRDGTEGAETAKASARAPGATPRGGPAG